MRHLGILICLVVFLSVAVKAQEYTPTDSPDQIAETPLHIDLWVLESRGQNCQMFLYASGQLLVCENGLTLPTDVTGFTQMPGWKEHEPWAFYLDLPYGGNALQCNIETLWKPDSTEAKAQVTCRDTTGESSRFTLFEIPLGTAVVSQSLT